MMELIKTCDQRCDQNVVIKTCDQNVVWGKWVIFFCLEWFL